METRNDSGAPDPQTEPAQTQSQSTASGDGSSPLQGASGKMQKGVYLSALVYVEGYLPPAGDFNTLAISTLTKTLKTALEAPLDGLTATLKSVDVQNDVEQGDGSPDTQGPIDSVEANDVHHEAAKAHPRKKGPRFQF